ncbi:peptidase G2 autoproteolytic cleavage domain-containing protein [Pseudovibrio sp. SPO723]|uniref:peptidase G2 autoproteolytic cleavage domain-containing protein n=1 Tax=Nesiotobacter zosterae TaxID=392721 RepID=UPI0029C3E838|nr:peptidase G2 autoproteolytic cleavage domain-containing protein [Pseudovibrio sp. SPO723]MDX5592586.1 peptidase G2 autoproteolytic cleavage domain-containing protein [Pseudovibrio sp. SPO723]
MAKAPSDIWSGSALTFKSDIVEWADEKDTKLSKINPDGTVPYTAQSDIGTEADHIDGSVPSKVANVIGVSARIERVVKSAQQLASTPATEPAYSGGVNNTPTTSGDTTLDVNAIFASQNSFSEFVRAVNIGSIYSWAKGNVSGNYSSRQSNAWSPQSVNLASEECYVRNGFRGANVSSIFSGAENETDVNLAARSSMATGRSSVNIATSGGRAGRGFGAMFTPTITGGEITDLTIDAGGEDYEVGDSIAFYDRAGAGAGATAEVASVGASGEIVTVTVTAPGSSYSEMVDVGVDNGTGDFSANIAGVNYPRAYGLGSATIASSGSTAAGDNSCVFADQDSVASGQKASVFASLSCEASGDYSSVFGSSGSIASGTLSSVFAANLCEANGSQSVVMGRRTINNDNRSFAFGDAAAGATSTANRKFQILANGDVLAAGTFQGSHSFTDYAEYFENNILGTIPLGTLVALEGSKVRPAVSGDDVLGCVSATAIVATGDTPFTWQGRYVTGEFGEVIYDDIPDPDHPELIPDPDHPKRIKNPNHPQIESIPVYDDDGSIVDYQSVTVSQEWILNPDPARMVQNPNPAPMISVPRENPEYDPSYENIPRSKRPDEWTCVGLLGQIHTRVDGAVDVGDWVQPSDIPGVGTKSDTKTSVKCMSIKKPFDGEFAIAHCLYK